MGGLDPPIQRPPNSPVPSGFVYILASERNGTLYIGVTSNLASRIEQHLRGAGSQFAKKYHVKRLVWFEEYSLYADAIRRETAMKRWKRDWKLALIEKANPQWKDLTGEWRL